MGAKNSHIYSNTRAACTPDKRRVGEKVSSVPLFLPTVFAEKKGSVEIRQRRVSSKAEHRRETAKSRDKLLLVYVTYIHCQRTLACKMLIIMQNAGAMGEAHVGSFLFKISFGELHDN